MISAADRLAAFAAAALASGSRADMLRALQSIDPNGAWDDAASAAEGLEPISEPEARAALAALLTV